MTLKGCLRPDWKGVRPDVRESLGTLESDRCLVVLHAGGTRIEKRWGSDRFGRLAAALLQDPGLAVALVGGEDDRSESRLVMRVANDRTGRLLDWTGRLTLEETAWVLARCRVFGGCDSGVAHLAAALGVRTVVLFGPGDPRKWGLDDARHRVVRQERPCSPCALFGYQKPCRNRPCLREISVEQVAEAIRGLI
jgi:ADP-heptose:LPS heptosyltransferase